MVYFIFDVLKKTVDTMDIIETQLLRGKDSRFLSAKVLIEVETTMKELELKVLTATNISKTLVLSEKPRVRRNNRGISTMKLIMCDQELYHFWLVVQRSWKN